MTNNRKTEARRTRWTQFGQLYAVALLFTLVPFSAALGLQKLRDIQIAKLDAAALERAEDALERGMMDDAIYEASMVFGGDRYDHSLAVRANAYMEKYWVSSLDDDLAQARSLVQQLGNSRSAWSLAARGNLELIDGNTEAAIARLEDATRLDPTNAYATHQLGFAQNVADRHDAALSSFKQALRLNPNMAWVQKNIESLLVKVRRCEEDVPGLHPAFRANCFNYLGVQDHADGNYRGAREWFERAVETAPDSALFPANLAGSLYQLGFHDQARANAQRSHDLGMREHWILAVFGIQ